MHGSMVATSRGRVAVVLVVLVSVLGLGFGSSGGGLYDVATPSMGTAAPVGTMLLTRPTTVDDVRVGEVITFRNPVGEVYSHRVVARTPAGLRTRGDLNAAADAWTVTQSQLIGRVALRLPVGGWLVRAVPLLLLLTGLLWGLGLCLRRHHEDLLRLVRVPLALAATLAVLHPWVSLVQTGSTATPHGVAVSAVSTGIMPVRLSPVGDRDSAVTHVAPGEVATVHVAPVHPGRAGGHVRIDAAPDLDPLWWAVVVLLCLAPMGLALAIGLPDRQGETRAAT